MTQKEHKSAQAITVQPQKVQAQTVSLRNLEATQIISLDDFQELELQLARAAEPAKQRRAVIAAGIVLGLVLAAAVLSVMILRPGGHS